MYLSWLLWLVSIAAVLAGLRWISRLLNRKAVSGRVVLITGGGSGIGRRMALKFAANGCKVVIWDINTDNANKVAKEVEAQGGKAWSYHCNVGDADDVAQTAEKVTEEVGDVDVLINNAGIVSGKYISELSKENITRTFSVNVLAHFWTIQAFLPGMMRKRAGNIITISSAGAISASTKMCDYVASKFAVFGLNESLRLDLRRQGYRDIFTTAVCPYYINTGMFEGVKTRFPLLLPILDEQYVADRVFQAVEYNEAYVVLPWIVNLTFLARLFPVSVFDWANDFLGISHSMDQFKGRGWDATNPTAKKSD